AERGRAVHQHVIVALQERPQRVAQREDRAVPVRLEIGDLRDALLYLDELQARRQHVESVDPAAYVRNPAHDGILGGEDLRPLELIPEELVERAPGLVALLPLHLGNQADRRVRLW